MCAICEGEPLPRRPGQIAVDHFVTDHDHVNQRVRGLTCWQCNSALGLLKDDPAVARKAAVYLETHHALRSTSTSALAAA